MLSAFDVAERMGDKKLQASALGQAGQFYYHAGNYQEALNYQKRAMSIADEIGDARLTARISEELGAISRAHGAYSEALNYSLKSLRFYEESGDAVGAGYIELHIGHILKRMGNYEEALSGYQKAVEHFLAPNPSDDSGPSGLAAAYSGIASIYDNQHNYAEALTYFQRSLKIKVDIGEKSGTALCYLNIALTESHQGKFTEALDHCMHGKRLFEEMEDADGMAQANVDLGYHLYLQAMAEPRSHNANLADARGYTVAGLEIAKEIGLAETVIEAYNNLSDIDLEAGDTVSSFENYRLYVMYKDSLLNERHIKEVAQLRIQYETEKKDKEIELLNKEKDIKALQLREERTLLLASQLEAKDKENEIRLLNASNELNETQLAKTAQAHSSEVAILSKDKELKDQQLKRQRLVRNGLIAGTLLLLLLGLVGFRSLQFRRRAEKLKAVVQERQRISADLHDDIGSGLSRIGLLSEVVLQEARTPEAKREAAKIAATSSELSRNINEIIWTLNVNNDHLDNLVAYIRRYAAEYFQNSPVKLTINTPTGIPRAHISGVERRNILYAVKEALHNIMKHSKAPAAELTFVLDGNHLSVIVRDNGVGFTNHDPDQFGNGITNMRSRMEAIHGSFKLENKEGTRVTLGLMV